MRLYFTPRTIFWQVNSDALTSLAGSRALLLELAHPMVAAGVAQHSNYRGDPFGRLYRTMRTMTEIMSHCRDRTRTTLKFAPAQLAVYPRLWRDVPHPEGQRKSRSVVSGRAPGAPGHA